MKIWIILCFVTFLCGCWAQTADAQTAGEQEVSQMVSDIEQQSLKGLLDLSFIAIQAADICLGKDVDDVVRGLCQYINSSQNAQFDILQDVFEDYYGEMYQPPNIDIGDAGTATGDMTEDEGLSESEMFWQQQLSNLTDQEGEEFEEALLRFLVLHNSVGIAASIPCAHSAARKDVLDYCLTGIHTFTSQLTEIRGYLCGKYNVCEVEWKPEEVSLALNALNDGALGMGTITPGEIGATGETGEAAETAETSTAIGTATEVETVTEVATTVSQPGEAS